MYCDSIFAHFPHQPRHNPAPATLWKPVDKQIEYYIGFALKTVIAVLYGTNLVYLDHHTFAQLRYLSQLL